MDWKVPAAGAALGLLFSLLGGLIGRIGFGDLIFRSLFAALIMAGITLGLKFLLEQFIPDLFPSSAADGEKNIPGQSVDISVGDGELEPQDEGVFAAGNVLSEDSGSDDVQEFGAGLMEMNQESPGGSMEAPASAGAYEDSTGSSGTVEFEGRQEDPAFLARAVQTVMKREGES